MYIENRGSETVAYGFVYADENTRGFYTIQDGKLTIGGPGSGYWFALDWYQMQQAKRQLLDRFNLAEAV
jgi:hypothetical protein